MYQLTMRRLYRRRSARTQAHPPESPARSLKRPNPAEVERARRLLAHEVAAGDAGDFAAAAGRVYDGLRAQLAPLLGLAGVGALLERGAKLVQGEFACFEDVTVLENSAKLRACLQGQDPATAMEASAALFGAFFALITTFIGERLTTQALRSAWPTIEGTHPGETRR